MIICVQHRADGADRNIEPAGDLAVGSLKLTRMGGGVVEVGGEPRTVAAECMQLCRETIATLIRQIAALDRSLQRVDRKRQTSGG